MDLQHERMFKSLLNNLQQMKISMAFLAQYFGIAKMQSCVLLLEVIMTSFLSPNINIQEGLDFILGN